MKITGNKASTLGLAVIVLALMTWLPEIPAGAISWWLTLPAWLIITITAAARLYDINENSKRWFVRKLGFTLVAAGTVALILTSTYPTWKSVCLFWGIAFVWLTTPGMPPWHKYISGEWRQVTSIDDLPPAGEENAGSP